MLLSRLKFFECFYCKTRNRLPRWLSNKESACNTGDVGNTGSIPGSERPLGGGTGNRYQYSCLGNPKDRGAWPAIVHGVAKALYTTE